MNSTKQSTASSKAEPKVYLTKEQVYQRVDNDKSTKAEPKSLDK